MLPYQRSIMAVCFLGFVLSMTVIFCGCASSTLGKSLNVGIGVAKIADQVSTDDAEARGFREANRLVGDEQWRQILIGSVGVASVIGVAQVSEQRGHRTLAHVLRVAAIVVYSGAALHNVRVVRR